MDAEANLSKVLYKVELIAIKFIPILIAGIYFLNSILSCFNIDVPVLSHIAGMSLLTLLFLYLTSYAFKFCSWHRMFLHYILITDIINYVDYYYGIPLGYKGMLVLQFITAGLTLFAIVYLKYRVCK